VYPRCRNMADGGPRYKACNNGRGRSEDPEQCPRTVVDYSLLGQKTRAKLEEGESRLLHQVTIFLDSA
jgi:hypothetical protein